MAYRLPGSAAYEQVERLNSLDQFSPPAADLNQNGKRLYNLGKPAFNTDAAQAYGSLICQTYYNGTQTYSISSSTMAAIDTTNLTTPSFVATSTQVLVVLTAACVANSSGTGFQVWCLFNHGGTTQVGQHFTVKNASTAAIDAIYLPATAPILVTGLTIGNSYQFDWAWGVTAGTANLNTKAVTSGVAGNSDYGPAIMEVFSA